MIIPKVLLHRTRPFLGRVCTRAQPRLTLHLAWVWLCRVVLLGGVGAVQAAPLVGGTPLITGLAHPVSITHAGDDSGRLFLTLQGGQIAIYDSAQLLSTPFLDITPLVSCCGERGLLSVAFHPHYRTNGFFYINYTNTAGDTVIARYTVSDNPDVADPLSGRVLLTIPQPFSNHNGGQLQFGPDGYLYIGMGDGGGAGDPQNNAQNLGSLLGKLLRLDVDSQFPYATPPTNPFVGTAGARPEVWALGLRNPWRFSFDRLTGDLFVGDVGQGSWEEVDFASASSGGGQNYGWRRMEGTHCFNPATACNNGALTLPILEYNHGENDSVGCAIVGGYRYRGTGIPQLSGMYVYSDFCSGRIWGAIPDSAGNWTATELLDTGTPITTFGEDQTGELYYADYTGTLSRVVNAAHVVATWENPEPGPVSGVAIIRGWAFATQPDARIDSVKLFVDGGFAGDIPCCSDRGDVQAAYPQYPPANTMKSGWGVTFNWGNLTTGPHSVHAEIHSTRGETLSTETHTLTVVKPGDFSFLDQFTLTGSLASSSGDELLIEQLRVRDKVSQQQRQITARFRWSLASQSLQLVDSITVGTATAFASFLSDFFAVVSLWLPGLWRGAPVVQAAPGILYAVESPGEGEAASGVAIIRGWAFTETPGATLTEVRLVLDGQPSGFIPCCSGRQDVATAFPASATAHNSGWGLTFNYGNLSDGPHTVGVRVGDSTGASLTETRNVNVVRIGGFAFVDQFDVSKATARIEGEEIVLTGVQVRDKATQQTRTITVHLRWSPASQTLAIVSSVG